MKHERTANANVLQNGYEPRSGFRTLTLPICSLLFMGVPIGICEAIRPGGFRDVALYCGIASVFAIILAVFSIRGTKP